MPSLKLVRAQPEEGLEARSDDDLMRLTQAGSKHAFAALIKRHAPRVVQLCSRFVGCSSLGQELAQDTWVAVWQRRDSYATPGGFMPWVISIARNRCRNELRRRKIRQDRAPWVEADAEPSPEQITAMLLEERRRHVRDAVAELPEAMREALLLRYGEQLRYDEIESVVGASESTLRSRVHHGLSLLRKKLEKRL